MVARSVVARSVVARRYDHDYESLIQGSLYELDGFFGVDSSNKYKQLRLEGMLSNGIAMEKAAEFCRIGLENLRTDQAGRHGPVKTWNIYEVMCDDYCVISDEMHEMVRRRRRRRRRRRVRRHHPRAATTPPLPARVRFPPPSPLANGPSHRRRPHHREEHTPRRARG